MLSRFEIVDLLEQGIEKNNKEQMWILDNLLFLHISGSRLYGINREDSDYDIRGVTLAPKDYWVGGRGFEQLELKIPEHNLDIVVYDFRKWLKLTVHGNPNVLETLYVREGSPSTIFRNYRWTHLAKKTKKLMNIQVYDGYRGYSHAQIKKMVTKQSNKTGRKYITDEYGFDLKFASHGFRLINQGAELLSTGNIVFPRPDADHLKAIREGKIYGPEDVDKCAKDWQEQQKILDQAKENTCLAPKLDFDKYSNLLVEAFDLYVH
jgi:hypothetical protein